MARKADETSDRQFVHRVLIVLGLTALFILAWQLRTLLLMFFGAVVVATVFRTFGDRLEKMIGCRPGIAVALSITLILGLTIGLIALFGVAVGLQFSIAIAQTLLAVAFLCWLALVVSRREPPQQALTALPYRRCIQAG